MRHSASEHSLDASGYDAELRRHNHALHRAFACTSEALKRLDPAAAARAVGRLREALAAHQDDDGVWFSSRAWIIAARRR